MPIRRRITVLGVVVLLGATLAIAAGEGDPAPDANALRLEVTIDGETFELLEGKQQVLRSGNRDLAVTVRRKPVQTHATDHQIFDYDLGFSLKDDRAPEHRTVTLIHASGASLVVTDFGPITEDQLVMALAAIVSVRRRSIQAENPRKVVVSKISRVELPNASGMESTILHTDVDGDSWVCRTIVVRSNGRGFSLIHQYDATDADLGKRLAQPTLDSVRTR